MIEGCGAYMNAWITRPRQIARMMMSGSRVSNMGKAMKPHPAARIVPIMYTGRRPIRSVSPPMSGTTIMCTMCAMTSQLRIAVVSISSASLR